MDEIVSAVFKLMNFYPSKKRILSLLSFVFRRKYLSFLEASLHLDDVTHAYYTYKPLSQIHPDQYNDDRERYTQSHLIFIIQKYSCLRLYNEKKQILTRSEVGLINPDLREWSKKTINMEEFLLYIMGQITLNTQLQEKTQEFKNIHFDSRDYLIVQDDIQFLEKKITSRIFRTLK